CRYRLCNDHSVDLRAVYRQAAGAFARAVIRSVEPIVQPAAKDAVGEMAVRGDLSSAQMGPRIGLTDARDTRSACGVERAKVHPKALYFPSPTGNCQYPPCRSPPPNRC